MAEETERGEGEELAEALGRKMITIELGGQKFALRAFNLNDLAEIEQQGLPEGMQLLRYQLWVAARRGGYQGSLEEIAGLVGWEDVERVREAIMSLAPPFVQQINQAAQRIALRTLGIEDRPGDSSGSSAD